MNAVRCAPARGFTLIEVMVSITVLSLIMLATVAALRTLANTQVSIEQLTGRVDEVRSVSTFVRELLETAIAGSSSGGLTTGGGGREMTFFQHGEGFLAFKSTVMFGEGVGGSYLVRIAQENGRLVLRWQRPPAGGGDPLDWFAQPSRVLVESLEEFSVAVRADYGEAWTEHLAGQDLPVMVRLRIRAAGRYWPDLIMPVQP
ncbi:MAG: prepilin-type N-terminal cleavage/methylation domain-containing protein [Pseudomonadota bacterium]